MKVPLSWLKDYVDIPIPVTELADRLTVAGLEVETIEYDGLPGAELPWDPDLIVVGEIRSVRVLNTAMLSRTHCMSDWPYMTLPSRLGGVTCSLGAEQELKDKILGNMSARVRTYIQEEMEFMGPMRLSEVEEVQLRIVQQVRQLEDQGQITITRGDASDEFV